MFRVAKQYMIRFNEADLQNDDLLSRMSAKTNMSKEQIVETFSEVAKGFGID